MAELTAGHSSYSKTAIALHWVIAVLVLINVAAGIYMSRLLDSGDPNLIPQVKEVAAIHKPIGVTILLLTLWRIALRLREDFLPLPAHMRPWEIVLARGTHIGFYVLLLVLPLSGWSFAVTPDRPLEYLGLFDMPVLPWDEAARDVFHTVHEYAGRTALVLVVLHIIGAAKHHFLDRDDVAARMLPFLRRN